MDINAKAFRQIQHAFRLGLDGVEYLGLLVIAFATTVAMYDEVLVMLGRGKVTLRVGDVRVHHVEEWQGNFLLVLSHSVRKV